MIIAFIVSLLFLPANINHGVKYSKTTIRTYPANTLIASNLPAELELSLYKWKKQIVNKQLLTNQITALNQINAQILNSRNNINFKKLYKLTRPLKKCKEEKLFTEYLKQSAYINKSYDLSLIISQTKYKYLILFNKAINNQNLKGAVLLLTNLSDKIPPEFFLKLMFDLGRKLKYLNLISESYLWFKVLILYLNKKAYLFKNFIKTNAEYSALLELAELAHKSGKYKKSLFILKYASSIGTNSPYIDVSKCSWKQIIEKKCKTKNLKTKNLQIFTEKNKESADYQKALVKWSNNTSDYSTFEQFIKKYPNSYYIKQIRDFIAQEKKNTP